MKLTKTQLRELIREVITEASVDEMEEFQMGLVKQYKNKKINGYELDFDELAGTIGWDNGSHIVMATPFFDGEQELPVNVITQAGDDFYERVFKFRYIPDVRKMEAEYFKILNPILKKFK